MKMALIPGLWQTKNRCGGFPLKIISLIALAAVLALTACKATAPTATRTPNRAIYPDPAQAKADLAAALKTAASTHKRILLDFGGNWCADCKVLDIYFHDPANRPILEADFELVHVNIGHMDANLDIAQQYEVPLSRGVPALAVLDEHGKLLYSQKSGEFEAMRRMESAEVTKFLVRWEPEKPCSAVMVNC
jgi:thiol:disulfide interchange protein